MKGYAYLPTSFCKNPGDWCKKSRRFSRHGKKRQNYDFWLTNKSVNSYITQKSTLIFKKGGEEKKQ